MNVNKKLGRLRQWAGERMGGEIRTNSTDEFKMLEMEMGLRYNGIKKNHQAMNDYVKFLSQKSEGVDGQRQMPVAALGSAMLAHGEDFEVESQFGQCLTILGHANEQLARVQDSYVQKASSTWLESLEHSRAQHKELGQSRKKLEDRRLAFDTASLKVEKSKKDDFRAEEELRSQRAKYEETNEDVFRRMMDIKEMEADSVEDLTAFLDCQLAYFERCREVVMLAKREWPATSSSVPTTGRSRRNTGSLLESRSNTARDAEVLPLQPPRPNFAGARPISNSQPQSPVTEKSEFVLPARPGVNRSVTYDGFGRDVSPPSSVHSGRRIFSDTVDVRKQRSQLRSVSQRDDDSYRTSPVSFDSNIARDEIPSNNTAFVKKRPPPPPPPSRSTKPQPPLLPPAR